MRSQFPKGFRQNCLFHFISDSETAIENLIRVFAKECPRRNQEGRIGFITIVPALGFKRFEIIEAENPFVGNSPHTSNESHITNTTTFLNNEFEINVDPDNAIVTVSKGNKVYFRGNELLLEEELGDLYYHRANLGLLKSETGEGVKYGSFKADSIEINKGNLRSYITLKSKYYALRWPYRLTDKLKPLLYRHDYIDIKKGNNNIQSITEN
jgi:alpha-mannosidase